MTLLHRMFVTILLLGIGTAVFAQGRPGMRNYDPKTETTVKGTVQEVQEQTGRHGWKGTHVVVKTDSGTLSVHIGPSSYISSKQFSFAEGDQVEILGSKVTIGGTETLLAREITKDGKTLVLRDAQGIPQWAGGRRRN
jgi:hypothetical protein